VAFVLFAIILALTLVSLQLRAWVSVGVAEPRRELAR
jgi:hypothetical protein